MTADRLRLAQLATAFAVLVAGVTAVNGPARLLAQEEAAPAPAFAEELDVTLVTTSFYVVDAEGRPVRDLRPEEVEVSVAGEPLPLAHFEALAAPPAGPGGAAAGAAAALPGGGQADAEAAPLLTGGDGSPRHVFLFFDLAFSLPRGVAAARRVAADLVESLPPGDLLYLVTYQTDGGLEQELGPVRSAAQRGELRERIAAIEPDAKRLRRRPDLQPIAQGRRSSGSVEAGYAEVQISELVNYELQGADLAKHLESFAVFLRQLPGPKVLLYFSQGIDSDVYGGAAAGVVANPHWSNWDVNRLPGLHNRFEPALRALSQTGAMVLFVNPIVGFQPGDRAASLAVDADPSAVNDAPTGDGTLQLMSESSGGIVLRDPDPESLRTRLDGLLGGRYELGVYLAATPDAGALAADIRVRRPGTRAWTAKWLQPPRTIRQLAPAERAFLAVQLVVQNDPRLALRNLVAPRLEPLRGIPETAPEGDRLRLRFHPDEWGPDLMLRGLDLYSVVLTPGDPPEIAGLDQRAFIATPGREPVESLAPAGSGLLWGLVAFDLTNGRIYLGRFPILAPGPAAATPAPAPTPSR